MFNKYTFEAVFGILFGTGKKVIKYPDPDNNEFEISFRTPNNSEDDVRFEFSTAEFVFFRNFLRMEIWDGDQKLYESNQGLSMFVNETGEDPLKDDPTGHPKIARKPRTEHLLPNHDYVLKVYRTAGPSPKNPISIQYYGTDGNEVQYANELKAEPIPMMFGGVPGMFVPD